MTNLDPAIKEVWTKEYLSLYNNVAVMEKLVNTQYEGEIKQGGDVVHARIPGDVTINAYTREQAITYQTLTNTINDLTINQQQYFAFRVDDLDKAQIDVNVISPSLKQAAIKMRNVIDTRLLSHYANTDAANVKGSTASPIVLTKDNVYGYFASMQTLLSNQNVMGSARNAVVPPYVKELIMTSPQMANRSTQMADQVIKNGVITEDFAGWKVAVTTNMAQVSGSYPLMFFTDWFINYASQVAEMETIDKFEQYFGSGARGLFLYGSTVFTQYDGEGAVLYAAPQS